jgi:hypothetical protein
VKIISTALADLRGIWRLLWGLLTGSIDLRQVTRTRGQLEESTP